MSEVVVKMCNAPRHKSFESDISVFDSFQQELLVEILQRLPLKVIFGCKCVSKTWLSLISSSYFIRCHVHYHQVTKAFAFYYQLTPPSHIHPNLMGIHIASRLPIFESSGFSLSFIPSSETLEQPATLQYLASTYGFPYLASSYGLQYLVSSNGLRYLASSNGLVLCYIPQHVPMIYFVCSPLTKKWIALPPPPPCSSRSARVGFISYPNCLCIGSNEDQVTTVRTGFKVIRIEVLNCELPKLQSDTVKLQKFCSETGRWTEEFVTPSSMPEQERFYGWNYRSPDAVICNGLLHWNDLSNCGIFMYDPQKDKYKTIELPLEIKRPKCPELPISPHLGVSCGRLRYVQYFRACKVYKVWELKSHTTGIWSLLHRIHVDQMESKIGRIDRDRMCLVSLHPLDEDIIYMWCGQYAGLVECNMRTRLLQSPCFLQAPKPCHYLKPTFFPFVLPCWPASFPILQQPELH